MCVHGYLLSCGSKFCSLYVLEDFGGQAEVARVVHLQEFGSGQVVDYGFDVVRVSFDYVAHGCVLYAVVRLVVLPVEGIYDEAAVRGYGIADEDSTEVDFVLVYGAAVVGYGPHVA